ncbi:MAG: class I SAM-dependent methyltransferase [Candidatus Norongarragalinales archaeon]
MKKTVVSFWKEKWENDAYGGEYSQPKLASFIAGLLDLSRKKKLLDVGCGAGSLLKKLPAGEKVGLDYSRVKIREARKNVPEGQFFLGEAADLPFASNSFDAVLTHSTFLHYDRDYALKALAELERVCKKGGRVLVGDIPEIRKHPLGTAGYHLRTVVFLMLKKGHYVCYDRSFFERRGYSTFSSPLNDRFYALKTKK